MSHAAPEHEVKVTRLTPANVDAIKATMAVAIERGYVTVTATTATFRLDNPARFVRELARLHPDRHPGKSLYAVVRKIERSLESEASA